MFQWTGKGWLSDWVGGGAGGEAEGWAYCLKERWEGTNSYYSYSAFLFSIPFGPFGFIYYLSFLFPFVKTNETHRLCLNFIYGSLCISLMAGYLCDWRPRPIPGQEPGQEEGGPTFRGLSEQASAREPVGEIRADVPTVIPPLSRDSGNGICVESLEPVRMLTAGGLGL